MEAIRAKLAKSFDRCGSCCGNRAGWSRKFGNPAGRTDAEEGNDLGRGQHHGCLFHCGRASLGTSASVFCAFHKSGGVLEPSWMTPVAGQPDSAIQSPRKIPSIKG